MFDLVVCVFFFPQYGVPGLDLDFGDGIGAFVLYFFEIGRVSIILQVFGDRLLEASEKIKIFRGGGGGGRGVAAVVGAVRSDRVNESIGQNCGRSPDIDPDRGQ